MNQIDTVDIKTSHSKANICVVRKMVKETYDFLMPNGMLIPLQLLPDTRLDKVKSLLLEEARKYPAYELLGYGHQYVFGGVTLQAETEEFPEENLKLSDLSLYLPCLTLSIPRQQTQALKFRQDLEKALGISVDYLDTIKSPEIQDFRRNVGTICQETSMERQSLPELKRLLFYFPPILDINTDVPMHVAKIMTERRLLIKVNIYYPGEEMEVHDVHVDASWTPTTIIYEIIFQKYSRRGETKDEAKTRALKGQQLYVLKSCTSEEYMIKECCLHSYKYIRHCITWDIIPAVTLTFLDDLLKSLPKEECTSNEKDDPSSQSIPDIERLLIAYPPVLEINEMSPDDGIFNGHRSQAATEAISSWDLDAILSIRVNNVTGQKAPPHTQLRTMNVVAGIYHGSTLLCKTVTKAKQHGWHQAMAFDIRLPDLPRSAKLCLSLCSSKKTVEYWVNIQLFDHKSRLVTGKQKLPMWPSAEAISQEHETVPLGITGCNPDFTFPTLEIEIICPADSPIMFPSDKHIHELISEHEAGRNDQIYQNMDPASVKDIDTILGNDILVTIKKHHREYLWKNREQCWTRPKSLPKLLTTLNWSKRTDVFELYKLLTMWPKEKVTFLVALQLLDAEFPDPRVEQFAVDCLATTITDETLLLNLMQLTQALKFRSYVDGPLTRYLLRRSLQNRRAGKQFFWYLRSEIHSSSIRLRFAPILELYCCNCGPILQELLKEVELLNFSCKLSQGIKSRNEDPEMSVNYLKKQLTQNEEAKVLKNSPLIIGRPQQLDEICPEKCGVFTSKMQPLRLTWTNSSPFANIISAETFSYIFKHGDDIRQDMLCIQLLENIDMIWKYEGLDLCLTPYGCLSLGHEIGMIEMVPNSKTVASIHSERGMLPSATGLNGWLHENNRDCYEKAVKRFTHSCAGYTVATFVLGISDRHFDNIMIKNNGELFHIDFGHFLGNGKRKFGIKRERVPCVMPDDFIQVITKGVNIKEESENYNDFVLLCINAYMALWKNADQLITPLYLMRNSGLPELKTSGDIEFVRKALAVDKDQFNAASYFLDNLKKAINRNRTITVDRTFHAINQYRRP